MIPKPKIAVIIINYATPSDTIACVESLQRQTYSNIEIIVIDNNSPDCSCKDLSNKLKGKCHVIELDRNLGFSGANNLGIDYALKHDAVKLLFLNSDTILDTKLIESLEAVCDPMTVAVPKTYYYNDKNLLWDTGSMVTYWGRLYNRGINEFDHGQYKEKQEVPLFTGHCLLIHKKTIEDFGKWEESYFMYVEDTEYSLRMAQHGVKVVYTPDAILWHKVGQSSGGNKNPKVIYYTVRNRLYLFKENPVPLRWKFRNICWIASLVIRCYVFRKKEFALILRAVKDYRSGVRGKVDFGNDRIK